MGIIDSFSNYSLYDVVDGTIPVAEKEDGVIVDIPSVEYMGMHITPINHGEFIVSVDGHAGTVLEFDSDEYDDVLELVDDLNGLVAEYMHLDYQEHKDELVEWAGRIITDDPERAKNDDRYIYIGDEEADR